jgi:hypothetical protein
MFLFTVGPPDALVKRHLTLDAILHNRSCDYTISHTYCDVHTVSHLYKLPEVCIIISAQCDEPLFVPTRHFSGVLITQ